MVLQASDTFELSYDALQTSCGQETTYQLHSFILNVSGSKFYERSHQLSACGRMWCVLLQIAVTLYFNVDTVIATEVIAELMPSLFIKQHADTRCKVTQGMTWADAPVMLRQGF